MAPARAAPTPCPQGASPRGHPKTAGVQAAFQPPKSTKPRAAQAGVRWMDRPQGFPASGQTDESGSVTSTMEEQQGQGWGAPATALLAPTNAQTNLLTPPRTTPLFPLIKKERPKWGQGHPQKKCHLTSATLPAGSRDDSTCASTFCLISAANSGVRGCFSANKPPHHNGTRWAVISANPGVTHRERGQGRLRGMETLA